VLRQAKLSVLRLTAATGMARWLAASGWRQRRLLILCYHGISRYDEHEWNPSLYMTPAQLRRRLQLLQEEDCNVLPLGEAISRLRSHSLPPRAVALTFDDGLHDFYSAAYPVIESFGFPVTLYLSTYYVEYNRPVFDVMCSYLLWKGRAAQVLEWPEVLPASAALATTAGRQAATGLIREFASSRQLSAQQKDRLLQGLAERLGVDFEELCRRRVMHLITPEEAAALAARGVSLQYHTHRHRVHKDREQMFAELRDNRMRLESYTAHSPEHFCYPSGLFFPELVESLAAYGMRSATTCLPGICSRRTHPLLLPRLVDTSGTSELEFRGWLAGIASLFPRRTQETESRPM
jgi:peptidoglycan/xylan/chitin deacetylase (PgdA/CDA1 family)